VAIVTRGRFIDPLTLKDQGQGFFRALRGVGKLLGFVVGSEGIEVVVTIKFIRGSVFGVAPDSILENLVPHVTSASVCESSIVTDLLGIDRVWIGWLHGVGLKISWSGRALLARFLA
jgi:hypothetical protein